MWKNLSRKWLSNQVKHTEIEFGHHPKLGTPIARPPCGKKIPFNIASHRDEDNKSVARKNTDTKDTSSTSTPLDEQNTSLQERAGWHNLDVPDTN
jgi:hypothetical protein